MNQFGKEISVTPGNGYCFLSYITKALARDCGVSTQRDSLANQVLDHMYEHSNYYASFHGDGSTWSMLKQAEEFLLCGKYILNIADVCVAATANYLCMNLYIFENLGGKAVIIQQRSAIEKTSKGLFLCFTRKPNGIGHENHYDAIVDVESIPFHLITNEDKSKPSTPPQQHSVNRLLYLHSISKLKSAKQLQLWVLLIWKLFPSTQL